MRRRSFLASGLAGLAALSGCVNTGVNSPTQGTPTRERTATNPPTEAGFADLPVPESELDRGAPKDAIPAITEPAFGEDWTDVKIEVPSSLGGNRQIEPRLQPDDPVIGVERQGEARAYPLRLLNWHEVCNDDFGGPLLVTYCPLCRTGLAADRTVDGEATVFGVSGLLYRSNLVMYDQLTESFWSQIGGLAIRGEKTGTRLELGPSTITGWANWQESYPDTTVLLPPPESSTVRGPDAARDYTSNPYAGYDSSRRVGLGREEYDDRLHPKTMVIGVASDGVARAYPHAVVEAEGVVNDAVGDLPVVVTLDASDNLVAYDRRVDGEPLEFETAGEATLAADGSTWRRTDGLALDGPHEGTRLARANDLPPMFWFSWADRHEDSEIFGR